jgi:hypothetical protein
VPVIAEDSPVTLESTRWPAGAFVDHGRSKVATLDLSGHILTPPGAENSCDPLCKLSRISR